MKIRKIWTNFEADHSSTSYRFYSSTKRLGEDDKALASSFSSRAALTQRSVGYVYHSEFGDLPSDAPEQLLTNCFDIMVSESYDWWELILVFPFSDLLLTRLKKCETQDVEQGVQVSQHDNQIFLTLYCTLDYGAVVDVELPNVSSETSEKYWFPTYSFHRPDIFAKLANLLIHPKNEIMQGNFDPLLEIALFYDTDLFDTDQKNGSTELGSCFIQMLEKDNL